MQETRVQSLVQQDPTYSGAPKALCHILDLCSTAWEPPLLSPQTSRTETFTGNHNCWALGPQVLKRSCPRACAPQWEKPARGAAHAPQLERSPHAGKDPAQPEKTVQQGVKIKLQLGWNKRHGSFKCWGELAEKRWGAMVGSYQCN